MGSIATRTGDDGTTGCLYGQRLPKYHPQIEALGAFDELNVALGAVRLQLPPGSPRLELLSALQGNLVALMGELACLEADAERYIQSNFAKLVPDDLARIDATIAAVEGRTLRFEGWATPGKNPLALSCDQARVAARRAERRLSALPEHGRSVRPLVQQYTNRLSDLLWLLARAAETPSTPPAE